MSICQGLGEGRGTRSDCCPGPGDCVPGGTITQQTAYKHEISRVEYRLHPYYGQELIITSVLEKSRLRVARCLKVGAVDGANGFEAPCWMFDRAYCASQQFTEEACVPVDSLMVLSDFLDGYMSRRKAVAFKSGGDEVDDSILFESCAEGAGVRDAGATSTGFVREPGASGTVAEHSACESGTGGGTGCEVAQTRSGAVVGKEGV